MADGVIFEVESNKDCLEVGRGVIKRVSMHGIPLLVVANEQEATGHMTAADIVETLELFAVTNQPWCK